MNSVRVAEIASVSARLKQAAADLGARAQQVILASEDVCQSAFHARQTRGTWSALWAALRDTPQPHRILTVCSFCRRVRSADGGWTHIPAVILERLQAAPGAVRLSHGMCPPCVYDQYGMVLWDDDEYEDDA